MPGHGNYEHRNAQSEYVAASVLLNEAGIDHRKATETTSERTSGKYAGDLSRNNVVSGLLKVMC